MRAVGRSVLVVLAVVAVLVVGQPAGADSPVVKVYGDGDGGWRFNRDPNSSTPYELTTVQASTGAGSLYVHPITNTVLAEDGSAVLGPDGFPMPQPGDKFVAELLLGLPAQALTSVSYDFLIAGPMASPLRARDFYLNVYVNLPGSTSFYDCRYDFVPTIGSVDAFTTAAFSMGRPSGMASRGALCPFTPAGMPEGSTITFMSINVGQSNAKDTGLAGYLDNVVVTTVDRSTTYDFDVVVVRSKEDCKGDGWRAAGFKNQGDCVSAFTAAPPSGKGL